MKAKHYTEKKLHLKTKRPNIRNWNNFEVTSLSLLNVYTKVPRFDTQQIQESLNALKHSRHNKSGYIYDVEMY